MPVNSWHHDIDPSNILVVSKGQGSPYDCDFKIADLGLAHFKRYISSTSSATDDDRYGMNHYGLLHDSVPLKMTLIYSKAHQKHIGTKT